jgi:hypothetical protein
MLDTALSNVKLDCSQSELKIESIITRIKKELSVIEFSRSIGVDLNVIGDLCSKSLCCFDLDVVVYNTSRS